MARNRLADVVSASPARPSDDHADLIVRTVTTGEHSCSVTGLRDVTDGDRDQPAPQQTTYPPPSNGVIPPSRGTNPYAQQNVGAAPGQGNYNQYGGAEPYGQQAQAGNPYAQQHQYGQQEQYGMGGVGGGNGMVAGGGDFWSELSSTNANLSMLQEQIQAVRSAHQQSLVRMILYHPLSCANNCSPLPTRKPQPGPTSLTRKPKPPVNSASNKSSNCSRWQKVTELKRLKSKLPRRDSLAC